LTKRAHGTLKYSEPAQHRDAISIGGGVDDHCRFTFCLVQSCSKTENSHMSTIAATEFLPLVATAGAATDSLVVSLHDVAPTTQQITSTIISELGRHGVRVCSILVVPDYHHEGLSTNQREFVAWLRALEADGHEIVIHGYFHERPRHVKETLRDKFVTRFYTQNEGEFYDLSYDEALRRITTARDEFRAHGLKPRGFVAPAWLLGTEAERAVRDAELEYTTRLRTVCDLRSGDVFPARTLVYSVHNTWRRELSRTWNSTLFRLFKSKLLLRISIHPPDYSQPAIWTQILGFIEATKNVRTATTYQDWIAEQRLRQGT
jgi:predicted deacetylase